MNRPTVLMVEDSLSVAALYGEQLKREPIELIHAATGAEAMAIITSAPPQAMLLDLGLPDMNGIDILRHVGEAGLPTAVIVVTAQGSINTAVEAMRAGAVDFLVKPFNAERLAVTLRNALRRAELEQVVQTYRDDFDRDGFRGFIGRSLAMQAVYRTIDAAATSRATVFVTGESGTGKEVCAEAIHGASGRAAKAFVALNCAAIPRDLVESEIFGHIKGSFTGAIADRVGAARRADGGTLFLDEIGKMQLDLQSKLLRFVQTGTFQRVGGSEVEKVDVRLVCATNRDPLAEVAAGRFREDLFYRLHVIPIHLPRLAERDDDVLLIARHFLAAMSTEEGKSFPGFDDAAAGLLLDYDWPGNVRQLQNVVRNIVVLNAGGTVDADMVRRALATGQPAGTARPPASRATDAPPSAPTASRAPVGGAVKPLWLVEKEAIERAVAAADGNIPRAAAMLEVSASTLYRKRLAWERDGSS